MGTHVSPMLLCNYAGGDARKFSGRQVSDAAIRHALWLDRERFGGHVCIEADTGRPHALADELARLVSEANDAEVAR